MAEVVGIVLGVIPLAIWALEKYEEPFEAWHRYHVSIEGFQTDLRLQYEQLRITFANVGLPDNPTSDELCECFNQKFPTISRELLSIVQRMDTTARHLLVGLDIAIDTKVCY